MITIETNNVFLRKIFIDYLLLWKFHFKNLNHYKVWISMFLMIISTPFYIIYISFYGLFLVCSFAQDFYNLPIKKVLKIILIILKMLLLIPSYLFIIFAYYPAIFFGSILTIITLPCEKLKKHLTMKKLQVIIKE